eukprot:2932509-Amphidinium_carterae.1
MQTLNIYEMKQGTISMMGKMNLKSPSPKQFDCRYPQFNKWSSEDKYTATEVTKMNTQFPVAPADGEDEFRHL